MGILLSRFNRVGPYMLVEVHSTPWNTRDKYLCPANPTMLIFSPASVWGWSSPEPSAYTMTCFWLPVSTPKNYTVSNVNFSSNNSGSCNNITCATAEALASQVTQENYEKGLIYPPFTNIRKISAHIAACVAAKVYELGESSFLGTRLCITKCVLISNGMSFLLCRTGFESSSSEWPC